MADRPTGIRSNALAQIDHPVGGYQGLDDPVDVPPFGDPRQLPVRIKG